MVGDTPSFTVVAMYVPAHFREEQPHGVMELPFVRREANGLVQQVLRFAVLRTDE